MVLPELALIVGAFGRLGSFLSQRVGLDGEIAVHEPDVVPVGF
jgi:hypothetical protein